MNIRWSLRRLAHVVPCLLGQHDLRAFSRGTLADVLDHRRDRVEQIGTWCMWCGWRLTNMDK